MAINTTSFSNTPQAQGDTFLTGSTGLTEDLLQLVYLDVMANDLGGNAKILWSLDDASSASTATKIYAPVDLLTQDTARVEVTSTDTSLNGAKIWITTDGKVGYDAASLSAAFKAQLEGLRAGESLSDSFTYAIRMANGTLSWATANVQFGGANDNAVITGVTTASVSEGAGVGIETAGGTLAPLNDTTHGTLAFTDVDLHDHHSVTGVTSSGGALGTLTASVTSDTTGSGIGGVITWNYSVADSAINHLAAGQTKLESFTIHLFDGTSTVDKVIDVTLTGTNDAPTVAAALTSAADEGSGAFNVNLLSGASDLDDGETASLSVSNVSYTVDGGTASGTAPAGVSLSGHTLSVDPANAAFNHLAAGVTQSIVVSYEVKDAQGATVAQSETITLTGTNDAPVLSGTQATLATGTENVAYTVSAADLLQGFTDVDGDSLSLSVLSANHGTVVNNGNGTFTITPTANYSGLESLSYNVIDGHGGSVAGSESFTLAASNAAPNDLALTITAVPSDTGLPGNTTFGQFSVPVGADPDGGGAYTYSMLSLSVTDLSGNVQTDTTPDLAVSSSGALSTGNGTNALQSGRIYEADIQVAQGSTTYHESFSIITGTNSGETIGAIGGTVVTNGDDVIYGLQSGGGNGVDVILAGTGNDTVFGQAGKDEIHGGVGNDVLYGGGGNDTFVFDTALNAATNVDLIADFASGSDKIGLSNASGLFDHIATGTLAPSAFEIIGATAETAATRIQYDPNTGALFYDADGSGGGAAVQFATLGSASHPTIAATDFVIGNPPPGP